MDMKRRFFALPLLTTAAALTLAGTHARLRAQDVKAVPQTPARPSLREWLMPGLTPLSDNGYPQLATLTAHTNQPYAAVFDYYAKRLGAGGYDLKPLATFQPPNHVLLSGVGLNFDAASSCFVSSQVMNATLSRRYAHETVSVYLSTDKQSHETYVSLTDTTF